MSPFTSFFPPAHKGWRRLLFSAAVGRELKLMRALAWPLILGEVSGMLMGVGDNVMIGHLGATPLAAASLAGAAFVMVMLLVWGSAMVLPSPIAQAHELGEGARVRTLLGASLVLALVFALVCCSAMVVVTTQVGRLGQDPQVAQLAAAYLQWIVFSLPFLILFAVLVQFVDAFGLVRWSMVVSITGLVLDILMNYAFIFGKWGMPALGMKGAALTTGINNALMSGALIWIILKRPELAYFRKAETTIRAVWSEFKALLKLGLPSGVQIMVEYAAFALGTLLIGQMGPTNQAAHQIALNLSSVSYVAVMGLSTAGSIRVGQTLAYGMGPRVRLAGFSAMVLAVLFMVLPMLLFLCFPGLLARAYIDDPAVHQTAIALLALAGLFQLADGLQTTSLALLRALGDVRRPTLISLSSFWVAGLPAGYVLAHYAGWNARGIWVGYLIALVLQSFFFSRRFWRLTRPS